MDIELLVFGIIIGIAGTGMTCVIFHMAKMDIKFMILKIVREHEKEFHVKELKERDGGD